MKECRKRAKKYGKLLYKKYKNDVNLNIFVSHSSIINSLINGILDSDICKERLVTSSLSICDVYERNIILYNKSFQ